MSKKELKIAIPTKGKGGLEDFVSDVFGRAANYTVIDVKDNKIGNVKVLENPAISYEHGAGPIVVKMLIEHGVNMVIAKEIGPGVSTLFEHHKIEKVTVNAGISVKEAVKKIGVKI